MRSTLDHVADWMSRQPWYLAEGDGVPRLRELAELFLPSPDSTARVRVLLLRDDTPESPVLYQVPIVERDLLPDPDNAAVIGRGYGGATIIDGIADPAFASSLLAGMHELGRLLDDSDDRLIVSSRVVSDDGAIAQIDIEPFGRAPLAVTLYRRPLAEANPDAVMLEALQGTPGMPRLVGTLPITWTESNGWRESVHLALVQGIVAGAVDGWTVATAAARSARSMTDDAQRMGAQLARTHGVLSARLPRRAVSPAEHTATIEMWSARLLSATGTVAVLGELRDEIEHVYDKAAALPRWPELQAVHGLLELSSTLRSPDGAWWMHNFGGTDPNPVLDRADLPQRDLASLLRSLDYAGGLNGSGPTWIDDVAAALTSGYASVAGESAADQILLDALRMDMAVVDAVYESRTRPQFAHIPLAAIARIVTESLARERDLSAA